MYKFYKYHGAGNDFILIDNRNKSFKIDNVRIEEICRRRFGIGADGLILLNSSDAEGVDFEMQYFNSDGNEGSMCGNGGRCIVAFAKQLQIIDNHTVFSGIDGLHTAEIISTLGKESTIRLQMKDVEKIENFDDGYFLDTGSPHFVKFVKNYKNVNFEETARKLRYDSRFENGTNVNYVEILGTNHIFVRTFERGVERETLSCGTGVTASALVYSAVKKETKSVFISTRGGKFEVEFDKINDIFSNIYLQGETCFVFSGEIII